METKMLILVKNFCFNRRFKPTDVPSSVSKGAPEFCTVYVIAKGKISSVRSASTPAPSRSSSRNHIHHHPRGMFLKIYHFVFFSFHLSDFNA